jgi:hypothetical protein
MHFFCHLRPWRSVVVVLFIKQLPTDETAMGTDSFSRTKTVQGHHCFHYSSLLLLPYPSPVPTLTL